MKIIKLKINCNYILTKYINGYIIYSSKKYLKIANNIIKKVRDIEIFFIIIYNKIKCIRLFYKREVVSNKMEEKNTTKTSLSTFLLILSLLIIIVLVIFIYKLNKDNAVETQKASQLESQVSSLSSTINSLQEKMNTVANNSIPNKYTEITSKLSDDDIFYVTNANKNNDGSYTLNGVLYTKFTLSKSELENAANNGTYKYYNQYGINPLYVNYIVKKNYKESDSDIKYDYAFIGKFKDEDRLAFVALKKDTNTYYIKNTTEYNDEWKLTNNYKKITISGDIEVENDYDSFKVKNYFNDFKEKTASEDSHPGNCFTFEFKNGKCSKVYECVTGH